MSTTAQLPDDRVTAELHAVERRRQRALLEVDLDALDEPLTNLVRTPDGGEHTLAGVAIQVLRRDDHKRWRFVSSPTIPYGEQR